MSQSRYIHSDIETNLSSAQEIVPVIIQMFHPKSIVDVGCGLGAFLSVFKENGVKEILGIDGKWVDQSRLCIDPSQFEIKNIDEPFALDKKFDVAICLEVAEHIAETHADIFLNNLSALSDILIFSAALKNQGGQNHINEQPFSYWQEKLKKLGFIFYDPFRELFWNNSKIYWWYRQNIFLVARETINMDDYIKGILPVHEMHEYVHPELFSIIHDQLTYNQEQNIKIKSGGMSLSFYLKLIRKKISRKTFGR
ncbi:MAG: class I SAM-dependent methyltransferase [Bacteroidetes bacterium]|nr:class I SAM-dependent methyltransferase [Bacteroidota bacterium]